MNNEGNEKLKLRSATKTRFPDKFEVIIESDSSYDDVLVPPLILQPLVENCFKHGRLDTLKSTEGKGEIKIVIRETNGSLNIHVLDNGNSQSQSLSSTISGNGPNPSGLGLKLSAKRLRLLYKDKANLKAGARKQQRGYQVSLSLPIR